MRVVRRRRRRCVQRLLRWLPRRCCFGRVGGRRGVNGLEKASWLTHWPLTATGQAKLFGKPAKETEQNRRGLSRDFCRLALEGFMEPADCELAGRL